MTDIPVAKVKGDLEKYMKNLGVEIDKELVIAIMQAAVHYEGELKQAINDVFTGGKGQLARNPKATLINEKGEVKKAGAFLDLVYADIQDQGGTIFPRAAKALAIPLTKKAEKRYPREWPRFQLTLIDRSKKGKPPLLVEEKGTWKKLGRSGGKELVVKRMEIHYVLKKSVTIRGKGYVERARRAAESTVKEIIGEFVGVAIEKTRPNTSET